MNELKALSKLSQYCLIIKNLCTTSTEFFFIYLRKVKSEYIIKKMGLNNEKKKDRLKNLVITLFVLEQFVIIYVIATRKGQHFIDWFYNLF